MENISGEQIRNRVNNNNNNNEKNNKTNVKEEEYKKEDEIYSPLSSEDINFIVDSKDKKKEKF